MTDLRFFTLPLLFCVFCTCVLAPCLSAQDARFNHMTASPQLINPALTGVMPGQLRFTANYQELYASVLGPDAYRGIGAGVEIRRPAGNGNFYGLGLQLQRDQAAESEFTRSTGAISGSYQQQIAGSRRRRGPAHFLSGGAQVGFGQRGFDLNKLWFSEQYFVDPGTREAYIDRGASNGEPIAGSGNSLYLDFSAGLAYFASLGDRAGVYLGVSGYHLNAPNVSPIQSNQDQLDRRYTLYGGGELPLGSGAMSLLPAVRVNVQGPSTSALIGSNLRYTQRAWREVAMRIGLWAQLNNQAVDKLGLGATVVSLGLETENLQFGVSYDLAMGNLNDITNSRGGFEVSMIYVKPANYREKVVCPKF